MSLAHDIRTRIHHWYTKTETCWIWNGVIGKRGYGVIRVKNKLCYAHRKMFEIENNIELEPSQWILHSCDNRSCVNPNHLRIGTPQDNIKDMLERKRQPKGEGKTQSKLTEAQVLEIKQSNLPNIELARLYNVSDGLICMIRKGQRWSHIKSLS